MTDNPVAILRISGTLTKGDLKEVEPELEKAFTSPVPLGFCIELDDFDT